MRLLRAHLLGKKLRKIFDRHAFLLCRVAVANGHCVFQILVIALTYGIEINRDAPGRADFVLRIIPFADISPFVPGDCQSGLLFQVAVKLARLVHELRLVGKQRKHRGFVGR